VYRLGDTERRGIVTKWNGKWHPLAERFAMLSEEEVRQLAASITEAGQLSPCLMTPEGLGLDGRNRVAACAIAEVDPRWEVTKARPGSVIIGSNVRKRHMTLQQQAMAVGLDLMEQGLRQDNGRWKRGSVPEAPDNVGSHITWAQVMRQVGLVLDWWPDLADDVLAGRMPLETAEGKADEKRKAQQKARQQQSMLPSDLAALVEAGVRTLDDAAAEAEHREIVDRIDKTVVGDGEEPYRQRAESGALAWSEAADLAQRWLQERDESLSRDLDRIRVYLRSTQAVESVARFVAESPDSGYATELLSSLSDEDRESFAAAARFIGEEAPGD
jgi:hypothetical protein